MKVKLAIAAFLLLSTLAHSGETITTITGQKYKDATISRVEPDGLVVVTDAGIQKIAFTDLPEAAAKKHGYDPEKAAAHSAKLKEAQERTSQALADNQRASAERLAAARAKLAQREDQAAKARAQQIAAMAKNKEQEAKNESATETTFKILETSKDRHVVQIYRYGGGVLGGRRATLQPTDIIAVLVDLKKPVAVADTITVRAYEDGFHELEFYGNVHVYRAVE